MSRGITTAWTMSRHLLAIQSSVTTQSVRCDLLDWGAEYFKTASSQFEMKATQVSNDLFQLYF